MGTRKREIQHVYATDTLWYIAFGYRKQHTGAVASVYVGNYRFLVDRHTLTGGPVNSFQGVRAARIN